MEQEPKYFWIRALAFIYDSILLLILTIVICWALGLLLPQYIEAPNLGGEVGKCERQSEPPKPFLAAIPKGTFAPNSKIRYRSCKITYTLRPDKIVGQAYARPTERNSSGNAAFANRYSSFVDEDGSPYDALSITNLMFWIFYIFLIPAILLRNKGRTKGKEYLGLKVIGEVEKTYKSYLTREALKFAPFLASLAYDIFSTTMSVIHGTAAELSNEGSNIFISSIFVIFYLLWYILPLIRWQGQMPYDRLTGFKVIKD